MSKNIIKLDFNKTPDFKTDLNDIENLEKLDKYILPIIERNEGWGTGNLTAEEFKNNPLQYQNDIDATVWDNVHILLENNRPIALLEFEKTYIKDTSKSYNKIFQDLLNNPSQKILTKLKEYNISIPNAKDLQSIKEFFNDKPIYSSIGIVVLPELQGQKTGISESLYQIISDGIIFGWTSNPIIVRQRKKLFKNTLYFPLFEQIPNTLEEKAISLYVYAYILSHNQEEIEGLELGALFSDYFVAQRGSEYIKIANKMASLHKISLLDLKRIEYFLSRKKCAGAIVSWN